MAPAGCGGAGRPLRAWRRTLVADSDPAIGRLLRRRLPVHGFSVELGGSGASVLSQVAVDRPDTVVVGSDLPDIPALDLVRILHRDPDLPLLVLLADPAAAAVIEALDAGADDCIGKPFLVGELAARLRKLVRRALIEHGLPTMIRSEALEIDCVRWHVRLGGRDVALSAKEHVILRMLVEEAGNVVGTRELLQRSWGTDRLDRTERVRRLVGRLRSKLGMTANSAICIQAEPQIGYRLRLPSGSSVGNAGRKVIG